jgi:hypothetical protein
LFHDGRHFLQKCLVLLACAVRRKTTGHHIHWRLWEVRLHVGKHMVWYRLCQMLDICRQAPRGFFQPVYQRGYLGFAQMWYQQPGYGQRGFFEFL